MTKRILVGGGTGFIGARLGELLTANHFLVNNISRKPGITNVPWTIIESKGLPEPTHAVVNLAGQHFMDFSKRWTPGFKQNVVNSRIITTKTLASAINNSETKPSVFVLVTGVGAYAPSQTIRYDETSEVIPKDFFSQLCVDWEAAADVHPPVRLVIIRSGVVIGRWGGMIKNMFMPFFLGMGGRIGHGKQFLPWIHIDDLTRLILFSIMNPEVKGILNGVAPHVITNEEFTKSFARALARPALLPLPEIMMNFLLHPERAMLMTQGQHVVPKRTLDYGFQYKYNTIDKACAEVAPLLYNKQSPEP